MRHRRSGRSEAEEGEALDAEGLQSLVLVPSWLTCRLPAYTPRMYVQSTDHGERQIMDTETDRGLTLKEAAARPGLPMLPSVSALSEANCPDQGLILDSGLSTSLSFARGYLHKEPSTPLVSDLGSSQVIARLEDEVRILRNELRQERETEAKSSGAKTCCLRSSAIAWLISPSVYRNFLRLSQ